MGKQSNLTNIRLMFVYIIFLCLPKISTTKWVEGQIQSPENWAFLTRFCFLSYDGQFEYSIEYNDDIGVPNLLLYYDDESQWPSVYHSNKTCAEKEAVLNKAGQNQIIRLSPWRPDKDFSGCVLKNDELDEFHVQTTEKVKTENFFSKRKKINKKNVTNHINIPTPDPTYYDQFLINPHNFTTTVNFEFMNTSVASFKNYTESEVELFDTSFATQATKIENMMKNKNISNSPMKYRKITSEILNEENSYLYFDKANKKNKKSSLTVICHNMRRFRSVRERWWFIAVSNCDGKKDLNLKYKFLMTNGPPGDYWHEHFSADEFYVLPILMAFCFAYVTMILAIVMCTVELKTRQMLHTTYKLFVLSVCFQQSGILLQSLAYVKYAINGVGANNTKMIGQLFCGMSEITYLLLLILMAKGFTITRGRLKILFTVKLTIFICCYTITFVSLFIYQSKEFDPGEVLYLYESPIGYAIIVLRILAWFLFIYAIIFTIKKYPEKGVFYYPFSLCGTMWFYAGPLFILTANNYIDKWVRESVVTAVLHLITFCGHISFLLLTLPVFANKNFPYHIRTTQIGVMEILGHTGGNSTMDHFDHNIYTANSQNNIPSVIIPLTRRTQDLVMDGNFPLKTCNVNTTIPRNNFNKQESLYHNDTVCLQTLNNVGPRLSISTQNSAESVISDKILNNKEKDSHSLENRFIPKKMKNLSSNNCNNGEVSSSIFSIEDKIDFEDTSYKNDPVYIQDINNPFLIKSNIQKKIDFLDPLKSEMFNKEPPQWSLAKSYIINKNRKETLQKNNKDYKLQGVIGTFPLPQIAKKEVDKRDEKVGSCSNKIELSTLDANLTNSLKITNGLKESLDEITTLSTSEIH